MISIDVCVNGCIAFVGENERLKWCSKCQSPRFYPCSQSSCRDKSVEKCRHSISLLTSRKQTFYFSMLALFDKLISRPRFRSLLSTFQKEFEYFRNGEVPHEEYKDVCDGAVAKAALLEMDANFKRKCKEEEGFEKINLLLGIFYDGAQLFDKKLNSFHALVMNILNIPAGCRISNGIGAFVIGLQTISADKIAEKGFETAEKILFRTYLLQELKILEEGLKLRTKDGKKIFLQARLICNLYDTPALEKMLGVQCTNTKAYCPVCRVVNGTYRKSVNKIIHNGHRRMLPMASILRKIGQSFACCPRDYYTGNIEENYADINLQDVTMPTDMHPRIVNTSNRTSRIACDSGKGKQIC